MPDHDKFKTLTCLEGQLGQDPLLDEIAREVQASSVLEAMKAYIDELRGQMDNNARPYQKMARLFQAGITPTRVVGHHDGEALGLRTGDEHEPLGALREFHWIAVGHRRGAGGAVGGKDFYRRGSGPHPKLHRRVRAQRDSHLPGNKSFREAGRLRHQQAQLLRCYLLDASQGSSPRGERSSMAMTRMEGSSSRGGLSRFTLGRSERFSSSIIAGMTWGIFLPSAISWTNWSKSPTASTSDNFCSRPRMCWADSTLICPAKDYDYQHFGYFLLMDDSWAAETRRVFPNIKPGLITAHPEAAKPPGQPAISDHPSSALQHRSSTTFTFADPVDGNCDDSVLAEIREDMKGHETILDLLKTYSEELMKSFDNRSPYFLRLHELFNRGIGPDEVRGFLRGALISFHAEGFYKFFSVNTLDLSWQLGRFFTPWTGKTFDPISMDRLKEMTGGFEQGSVPTFWGTNTLSFKTAKQKFIRQLMKLAGVWMEEVPAEESTKFGYDAKSYFFIARKGVSINEENKGKKDFLFNYRWPKLRTFPPDNYCIDELVKIAEGLYLGQLIYATELLKKFDPNEDPSTYKYRLFGYFLLMDEDWQRRRLAIGFDPYDV